MYKCEKCKKPFRQKCDYERHLNRKKPCDAKKRTVTKKQLNDEIKVIQSGDDKDEIIKNMTEQIKIMSNEMKNVCSIVEEMRNKFNNTQSSTSVNNTVNNNTICGDVANGNIIKDNVEVNCQINLLVGFGKEDLTTLTTEQKKSILNQGLKGPLKYAEIVHCDTYKNIYVSNKKNPEVTVFNGDKWELHGKEYIDQVRDNGIEFMEEQFEELKEELPKFIVSKMTKFMNHMESEEADKIKKNMSKDIRFLFYNKKPDDEILKVKNIVSK